MRCSEDVNDPQSDEPTGTYIGTPLRAYYRQFAGMLEWPQNSGMMTTEPLGYRARKWAIQRLSSLGPSPTQFDRIKETDWDALIILDACRTDVLRRVTTWPAESCRSPASSTEEWLSKVDERGLFADYHVISANATYATLDIQTAGFRPYWDDNWDARLGTAYPEPLLAETKEYLEAGKSPVVTHLIQPHGPYIARVDDTWIPLVPEEDASKKANQGPREVSAQVAMATGMIDVRRARRAYVAAVDSIWRTVLEFVAPWVNDGQSVVITADHGEVFGRVLEFGLYEHPSGCHIGPLVTVPWVILEPGSMPSESADSVDEKLAALGYVTD